MKSRPTLTLMAKKPVPGQVKTRFFPDTTYEIAAAIAFEMIVETVEKVTDCWPGDVRLLISPDDCDPKLRELAARYNITIGKQAAGDLGEKMECAIRDALHHSKAAAVMGCDIPSVNQQILRVAYDRLLEGHNVIGPTADGGFYFAGFCQYSPGMLSHIEWSTPTVLEETLTQLQVCKMSVQVMLPCLNDMDHWRDFVELADQDARYSKYLTAKV